MKILRNLLVLLLLMCISVASVIGYKGYDLYKTKVRELPIEEAVSNIMLDEDFVSYGDISKDFMNATVAIEDHRFWFREGIDYIAIARALVANVFMGKIVEGGSTITTQVVKNIYFDNSANFLRKIAEIFFVQDFEKLYSKEEILALYVNIIYYGDGYYGIKQAAKGYYDKAPNKLDLYESAMIAGLPQAPSIYQLSTGRDKAVKRQKQVLEAMVLYDFISEDAMDYALLREE